jgi:hypothetical protein
VNYRTLSIAQFVFIFVCGLSVLDWGVELSQGFDSDEENDDENGFGFNNLIFGLTCDESDSDSDGYACENAYWDVIQLWGYCMIIVAILQLLKALTVEIIG